MYYAIINTWFWNSFICYNFNNHYFYFTPNVLGNMVNLQTAKMRERLSLNPFQFWIIVNSTVPASCWVYFQLVKYKNSKHPLRTQKKCCEPSETFNGLILYTNINSTCTHSLLLSVFLLLSFCISVCVFFRFYLTQIAPYLGVAACQTCPNVCL